MLSNILYRAYCIENHRIRKIIHSIVEKLEMGEFYSLTLRRIFEDYHQVSIGMYTHGGCFEPFHMDRRTTIGRYCSIARSARIMNRNHPLHFKSTHGLFFNSKLCLCEEDLVEYTSLTIGSDVWIGEGAIVMPSVKEIGHGAVVAAGAVVNKNVPPYAVVVGNPARVVRFRFPPPVIEELLASKWWEKSLEELIAEGIEIFQRSYSSDQESAVIAQSQL